MNEFSQRRLQRVQEKTVEHKNNLKTAACQHQLLNCGTTLSSSVFTSRAAVQHSTRKLAAFLLARFAGNSFDRANLRALVKQILEAKNNFTRCLFFGSTNASSTRTRRHWRQARQTNCPVEAPKSVRCSLKKPMANIPVAVVYHSRLASSCR
jgi:hypothetical protein